MQVTVISIITDVFETISKVLVKGLEDLDTTGQVQTII